MYLGSRNNVNPSNIPGDLYGKANVFASENNFDCPPPPYEFAYGFSPVDGIPSASYAYSPAEAFSYQTYYVQFLLRNYLIFTSEIKNDTEPSRLKNEKIAYELCEAGKNYVYPLKEIMENNPLPIPNSVDEKIVERAWFKFKNVVLDCIRIIENTPLWLREGLGAGFLIPELSQQMNDHLAELKKIDAILAAWRPVPPQAIASTQTDTLQTSPLSRNDRSRPTRIPPQTALRNRNAAKQRAGFVARMFANVETQTISSDQSHGHTLIKSHKDDETQTETPTKIAVIDCATQSVSADSVERSIQTKIRSHAFSSNKKTQIEHKKFLNKFVETNRIHLTGIGVQTDSEEMQFLNQGWIALHEKIEKKTEQIMAYAGQQLGAECWQDAEIIPRDLSQHFSKIFCFFKGKCEEAKTANEKRELWDSLANYFLPCMEQIRTARSQLFVSLFETQFTEQAHKKTAIESVISVLDLAILMTMQSSEWLQSFKWDRDKGKKSVLARLQTFYSEDEVLQSLLKQQYILGTLVYGMDDQSQLDERYQDGVFDMMPIESVIKEIAAYDHVQSMAAQQNSLIKFLTKKQSLFEHAGKVDIENFLLHMWLPSVATVKLLAQKKRDISVNGSDATDLERLLGIFLRDARWGLNKIYSMEFKESNVIGDPIKKRLLQGFKKIVQPESLGMIEDANLALEIIENKINEMHRALNEESSSWRKEQVPIVILAHCLNVDDFTLGMFEEWSNLIAGIKVEYYNMLRKEGGDPDMKKKYLEYLINAKTFYQKVIINGFSMEDKIQDIADKESRGGINTLEIVFGMEGKNAKSIKILRELAKNLGI